MQASVGWRWRAVACQRRTGCSTCRSSRQVAIDQRGWALPRNSVESGESYLSGAGSAGRKSTVERQQGRRPSTPWFTDLQSRPMEFLDFTSLTLNEFQQLVPPFETAFQARMVAWRMDGK